MTEFDFIDGKFKILQLTDIHLDTTENEPGFNKTLDLICKSVFKVKPDLIVVTGDLAWGQGTEKALNILNKLFDEIGIPWAAVLGNHDGNPNDSEIKSREKIADIILKSKASVFEKGPKDVDGYGNYTVSIGDNDWTLFFMDSHDGDFDLSQIEWYVNQSKNNIGKNELAFFHVPLPEYKDVWDFEYCKGFNLENVAATHFNDGLFSVMVRSGKMKGVFVGHDHVNDYEGTLNGIRLCYGKGSGYQCYGMEGYPIGARIIEIYQNKDDFETEIYIDSGKIYKQTTVHKPEMRRKH